MRACWEAVYRNLTESTRTLKAEQAFAQMKKRDGRLARFADPASLLSYLRREDTDLDAKDDVYAALVTAAQSGMAHARVATELAWLGLWPALDAIYRRKLAYFFSAPEELVSEIGSIFTFHLDRIDVDNVSRVASTVVRSVERDIMDARHRLWKRESRSRDLPSDEALTGEDERFVVARQELGELRQWLASVVGDDADMVIAVVVHGMSQQDLARELGTTYDAARKRFQRAIRCVRERFQGID